MKNEQAFTLIELLVVVLIIGILAAVAVPQYQKAVQKARLTEAITVLKSLSQAADVWVLANNPSGDPMELTNSLDIAVPTSDHWTYSAYWEPGDSRTGEYWGAYATKDYGVFIYREYYLDQKKWMWSCVGNSEDNTCTLFNQLVGND